METCRVCQQEKHLLKQQICYRCHTKQRPRFLCTRCGQDRPVHRRIGALTYCQSCSAHFRRSLACHSCLRVIRIVAHNLCGACYEKRRNREERDSGHYRLGYHTETYIEETYVQILALKAQKNKHLAHAYKELSMEKKITMISHAELCVLCDKPKQFRRLVNNRELNLCTEHYYSSRYAQLVKFLETKETHESQPRPQGD